MNSREEKLERLKKISGQILGIIKMIENDRYCIEILTQIKAVKSALKKVEELILYEHLNNCVVTSIKSDNKEEQDKKIKEIMELFSKMND